MPTAPKIQCPEPLLFFFADDYKRYRYAYGGRSSGKSWTAAQGLIVRALRSKVRILCCRKIQNSIKQSVKKTIENSIERLELGKFFTSRQVRAMGMTRPNPMLYAGELGNYWQTANDVMHTFMHPERHRALARFFCGTWETVTFCLLR